MIDSEKEIDFLYLCNRDKWTAAASFPDTGICVSEAPRGHLLISTSL
jgi:hypothetical protein